MFHLDRNIPLMDINRVSDKVSLTVPANRDYVGELKEGADDFLPQAGIPLQLWGLIVTEFCHQPLDLLVLRKSVELRTGGGFWRGRVVRMYRSRGGCDLLHRSNKGTWFQVDVSDSPDCQPTRPDCHRPELPAGSGYRPGEITRWVGGKQVLQPEEVVPVVPVGRIEIFLKSSLFRPRTELRPAARGDGIAVAAGKARPRGDYIFQEQAAATLFHGEHTSELLSRGSAECLWSEFGLFLLFGGKARIGSAGVPIPAAPRVGYGASQDVGQIAVRVAAPSQYFHLLACSHSANGELGYGLQL